MIVEIIMIISGIGWFVGIGSLLGMMVKGKSKIRPKVLR